MANSYHQIYLHFVFAVKNRDGLIPRELWGDMYAYAGGILKNQGHHPIEIGGYTDHIHILIGYNPAGKSIPETVKQLKISLNLWLNERIPRRGSFAWQNGYGCFSYSRSHLDAVRNYIRNQESHHRKESFITEYERCLQGFGIQYDSRYIFRQPE